jgi:3-oxoacyl-[acyl-carrier protein] reductase
MTSAMFGEAPTDGLDPLSPAAVSPLVAYLASPAAEAVNAQVFVVYGGLVAVVAAPTIAHTARTEGHWTPEDLAKALEGNVPRGGFSAAEALKFD